MYADEITKAYIERMEPGMLHSKFRQILKKRKCDAI